jgi:3-deoxy-D-manno-octulosonic-acid transferase
VRSLYRIAVVVAFLLYLPSIAWRLVTRPPCREGFLQKLGFGVPRSPAGTVWVHAVSVGEAVTAAPLVRRFVDAGRPVVVTVSTPTGRDVARQKMGEGVTIAYFPFDLGFAVARSVTRFNPALFVVVDTELWPEVIWRAKEAGAKVAMVNGRISDRSYPRYAKLRPFFRRVFDAVDLSLTQSAADAARLVHIGADPAKVAVAGNMKFDTAVDPVSPDERAALRASLGIPADAKVIFLGSVHQGEGGAVRAAVTVAQETGARIVIAPRRIEKIDWIETLLTPAGYRAVRKTAFGAAPPTGASAVPIIDTFGELTKLYAVADLVFVGGSMNGHGGQNPLEPAAHGTPVLFGPSMENFREGVAALTADGGGQTVADEAALADRMRQLLADPTDALRRGAAARRVVAENRGVVDRVFLRLTELIDE